MFYQIYNLCRTFLPILNWQQVIQLFNSLLETNYIQQNVYFLIDLGENMFKLIYWLTAWSI